MSKRVVAEPLIPKEGRSSIPPDTVHTFLLTDHDEEDGNISVGFKFGPPQIIEA